MQNVPQNIRCILDVREQYAGGGQVVSREGEFELVGEISQISYELATDQLHIRCRQVAAHKHGDPEWLLAWSPSTGAAQGFETLASSNGTFSVKAERTVFTQQGHGVIDFYVTQGHGERSLVARGSPFLKRYEVRTPAEQAA